jgi:hypothetical protein
MLERAPTRRVVDMLQKMNICSIITPLIIERQTKQSIVSSGNRPGSRFSYFVVALANDMSVSGGVSAYAKAAADKLSPPPSPERQLFRCVNRA